MLDPYDRRHLLEIIRPPEGYSLDFAIGTTFSLDLLALMTAPLGFTIFEAESESGSPDPLALIESLRRYAGRISIFCQAGRIHIPREYEQPLYTYLEGSVFQARSPAEGSVFHPKVWALRYISQDEPVAYRFLCLSRNLTYDRSWDTALVLDGLLADRTNAFASNHPLGDFLAALPGMVEERLSVDLHERIDLMQHEIRRVAFDLPPGFESLVFHTLGIGNRRSNPFSERIDKILVVSPFLSEGQLDKFASLGRGSTLVSRLDSLQKISSDTLQRFSDVFCLKEDLITQEDMSELVDLEQEQTDLEGDRGFLADNLDGLHAKLYVADAGREGRIWTGSANATDAAFGRNVEFLVELRGNKKYCGIDAVLNGGKEGEGAGLRTLLDSFIVSDIIVDDEKKSLKNLADLSRTALINANLSAHVSQDDDNRFSISIKGRIPILPEEAIIMCRPITLDKVRAVRLPSNPDVLAEFSCLLDREISAFFAFDVSIKSGGKSLIEGFVLKLPLKGAPADRNERILRALLKDKNQVLRLMLLLLSLDGRSNSGDLINWGPSQKGGRPWASPGMMPLFECMVRALASDQQRLDDLNNLIQDLKGHLETIDLLPDGLDEIWEPIWEARKMIEGKGYEKE
ncbi:phospholipase D family protein [Candidatus Methanocrinis natronophilus]|uniref:Phospholipase D family protein n=1 Tax=Candidatus Methanocrinis natronophilus TaxID=3033396 RepID=A0ABT5XA00_9EURY|nr:phospholipase D family protein [Candidatus Methanocrinis natronophilus]MDF0591545.1 phospholipase D family protein [Candidatus Methanocrinis natronophilus]